MAVIEICLKFNVFAVYSENDNHNYCHHEVLLSAFPLALEWLDFDPEQPDKKGEHGFAVTAAVGSFIRQNNI